MFEETTINLNDGKKFKVVAKGASKTKRYIQKAFLNGIELHSPFILHEQIMNGGILELVLMNYQTKSGEEMQKSLN